MKTSPLSSRFTALAVSMLLCLSCSVSGPDPQAKFEFEVSEVQPGLVYFTNRSENGKEYSWDFGDGETSVEEHPDHQYAKNGNYTVVLKIKSGGKTNTISQSVEVFSPILFLSPQKWKLVSSSGSISFSRAPGQNDEHWDHSVMPIREKLSIVDFLSSKEVNFPNGFGRYQYRILKNANGRLYLEAVIANSPTSIMYAYLDIDYANDSFMLTVNQETLNKEFQICCPSFIARSNSDARFVFKRN